MYSLTSRRMKIIFYAQSRLAAGCAETQLELAGPVAIAEFWQRLVAAIPALAPLRKTARLARRETYLEPGEILQPNDEIAVIPPVSGG
jgi:molybdopterin converting factor small subunit